MQVNNIVSSLVGFISASKDANIGSNKIIHGWKVKMGSQSLPIGRTIRQMHITKTCFDQQSIPIKCGKSSWALATRTFVKGSNDFH